MAKTLRGAVPHTVVFHADRGTQCTSWQLHKTMKRFGVVQSMGLGCASTTQWSNRSGPH